MISNSDKLCYRFVGILFSEEADDEEIAYAGSYLSLNFSILNEKIRNILINRFSQISESQLLRFFEVIDYLLADEGGRETEILRLLNLLQSNLSIRREVIHLLEKGNLSQRWKTIAILIVGDLMHEESMDEV